MPKIAGSNKSRNQDQEIDGAGRFNCDTVLKELNGIENQFHRKNGSKRRVRFKFCQKKRNPSNSGDSVASGSTSWVKERYKQWSADLHKPKGGPFSVSPSPYGWYQIKIFNGHIYEKSALMVALLDAVSPDKFEPHYWRVKQDCVIFFTNDFEMAGRIQLQGKSAQLPNGFCLMPRVSKGIPLAVIDDDLKQKMKNVMAKRYNVQSKALDLSRFYADPDLKLTFCPLFQDDVMKAALDIICENVPDLMALNLNENNLSTMETFVSVETRLPHLQVLYLEDNQLPNLSQLWVFHKLPIVELVLRQNPCRFRYKEYRHFVSHVLEKFPKLQKLNGEILNSQVVLNMRKEGLLPTAKASFICDKAGEEVVRQFIDQYFSIFDSENRQLLLDAYNEDAMLSISMPSVKQVDQLKSLRKFNRNLITDLNNNHAKLLKSGRLACVATLNEFPRTSHEKHTFTVDLTLCNAQLMVFTVTGLFKEMPHDDQQSYILRHFTRTFVVVPKNGGFCIRNETIFISNASQDQIGTYKRSLLQPIPATDNSSDGMLGVDETPTSSSSNHLNPVGNNGGAVKAVAPKIPAVNDDAAKMQMVRAFSAQSQMNSEWSHKCLEETNWDFSHATFVFDTLVKLQQIPAEAFVK
ncbi:nuclear RNA export factor 1-like [Drosophila tropicalis]|uniref:nuclear RNA export factor 1-like n=1 Tax=Drosophila tropicalis TaxID=46794 RepID=UPI0035AB7628